MDPRPALDLPNDDLRPGVGAGIMMQSIRIRLAQRSEHLGKRQSETATDKLVGARVANENFHEDRIPVRKTRKKKSRPRNRMASLSLTGSERASGDLVHGSRRAASGVQGQVRLVVHYVVPIPSSPSAAWPGWPGGRSFQTFVFTSSFWMSRSMTPRGCLPRTSSPPVMTT